MSLRCVTHFDSTNLDDAQTGPVARVGQLGDDESRQPDEQQPLVPVRYHVGRVVDTDRRRNGAYDEQPDEVDMRHEIVDELDDRDAIQTVTKRQRYDDPDRRQQQCGDEQHQDPPRSPVRHASDPDLRQVFLYRLMSDNLSAASLTQGDDCR